MTVQNVKHNPLSQSSLHGFFICSPSQRRAIGRKRVCLMQSLEGAADHSNEAIRQDLTSQLHRIMKTYVPPTPDEIFQCCDRLIGMAWDELDDETGRFLLGELEGLEEDLETDTALKIAEGICDVIEEENRSGAVAAMLKEARGQLFPPTAEPLPCQSRASRPGEVIQWSHPPLPFPEFSAA